MLIIGRKYYNKVTCHKNVNSLELPCFYLSKTLKNDKKLQKLKIQKDDLNINRRKFLYQLKNELSNKLSANSNTFYINNILKQSLFLDVEFTNDIYDDFKTFPISKDLSLLFMIGICSIDEYINLTVDRLNDKNEYFILLKFLDYLKTKTISQQIILFHWSNADKLIIEKTLVRHPDLYQMYTDNLKNKIVYIDLLKIVKQTIVLKSYSLKYVSEKLLNIKYTTDCKNGLDAMCSIFLNDQLLDNNTLSKKSLHDFASTNDIIQYNKMDTTLLYKIIEKFR